MIANDDPERLRDFRDKAGIEFPILLDPGAEVVREYDIVNEGSPAEQTIPHPTSLIIDRDGIVQYVRIDTDYRVRPPTSELVSLLRDLPE